MAAEKDSRVLNFDVPVNIAENLSKLAQMLPFSYRQYDPKKRR